MSTIPVPLGRGGVRESFFFLPLPFSLSSFFLPAFLSPLLCPLLLSFFILSPSPVPFLAGYVCLFLPFSLLDSFSLPLWLFPPFSLMLSTLVWTSAVSSLICLSVSVCLSLSPDDYLLILDCWSACFFSPFLSFGFSLSLSVHLTGSSSVCFFLFVFLSLCICLSLTFCLFLSLSFSFCSSLCYVLTKLSWFYTLALPSLLSVPLSFPSLTHYLFLVQSLLLTFQSLFHRLESLMISTVLEVPRPYMYIEMPWGTTGVPTGYFTFLREKQHYLTSVGNCSSY